MHLPGIPSFTWRRCIDSTPRYDQGAQHHSSVCRCYAFNHQAIHQGRTEILLTGHPNACSDALAQTLVGHALRRHIRDSLRWLVVKLQLYFNSISGFRPTYDSLPNTLMLQTCNRMAEFFTCANPMLRGIPDDVSEEDEEDEIAQWYWQEYAPNDLQDVPTGPDTVNPEQVSLTGPNNTSSICLICQEVQPIMRKTNACGHEYCEECLQGQLQSKHTGRYKCAACRAAWF
jgi:hypothetical protein